MKNLSVILISLFLAVPVLAEEVQTQIAPVSLNTNVSNEAESLELADLGAFLDQKVQEVSDLLSEKIAAELPALGTKETTANVKF
ncbi:MAG: hypothetical protein V4660_03340 [Pseudomonadota bacterium]